ncbi:MAG: restriction endonuclease subunit S [Dethiobacteria bacterium]
MKLGNVITINPESIEEGYPFDVIEYIEISSVGTGTLEKTRCIQLDAAPSRAKRIVKKDDILLATVRPNLRSFWYAKNPKKNMIASTGFAVLRAREKIDSRFLYYTVTNQPFTDYLTANAKGAAYPAVDTEIIKRAEISLPTLPIQRNIAAILSAYDDLIENNLRRIKILEEMAQALYREWFVHFRFPGHEKARLIDSPLGKIPEGWEVKELKDVCHLIMGQSPKSKYYNTDKLGLPFHQGVTDFGNRFPNKRFYCSIKGRIADKGDILFSVRAPVGRINIANTKMVIGRGLCAIRHKAGFQWYTFHVLKEVFNEEDIIGGGTIFKSVTKKDMERINLLTPTESLAHQFEHVVEPLEKQIDNLTQKNTTLCRTRDLLLPKLISGELDVSELDIAIPEED